jgi:hypothetical protein
VLSSVARQLRAANVALIGIVAGSDLSSLAMVYPSLDTLPDEQQVDAVKAVNAGFGPIMQPLVMGAVATGVGAAVLRPSDRIGLAATACQLGMLAVIIKAIQPVNAQLHAADDHAAYLENHRRWMRLHRARVAFELAGLACSAASAVRRP